MDINSIFKSKTRKELFRLFFTNSDNKYYLRELERTLNIPVSMIRSELVRLDRDGIFSTSRRGNLLFYQLNKNYPLYQELKSIVNKTIGAQGLLAETLKNVPGISLAFIYGSFARQEENAQSDIDLLVVGNVSDHKLLTQINLAEKMLKREINYNLYTPAEFKKQRSTKESFIDLVLKEKILILKGRLND